MLRRTLARTSTTLKSTNTIFFTPTPTPTHTPHSLSLSSYRNYSSSPSSFSESLSFTSISSSSLFKSPIRIPKIRTTLQAQRLSTLLQTQTRSYVANMASEYRLKLADDTAPSDIRNGHKIEVEVEGLEGSKVLLLKVNGDLRALSPRCTHYGAPLVKGVVTGDGRITCPWHGACFNTATGDIENAPALDHLNAFPIHLKNNSIYITATEEKLKAFSRRPDIKCKPSGAAAKDHVVIVGGGSGAIGAIESLREKGFKGLITCISKEPHLPIDRTKLSKALITDVSKIQWRDAKYFEEAGVTFKLNTIVSEVDFAGKKVKIEGGEEVSYTKLILATGGTAKRLPMDGFELGNVFTLRGIDDAKAIVDAVGENNDKKIVVIGSSFIGMEVGNCLAGKKNDVTIIGQESAPMERIMGAEVGKIFEKILTKNGVKFKLSAGVEKATPSSADPTKVGSVTLKSGENIPADLVILGVGVTPETSYIKDKSLLLKDQSLDVDEFWRIKGVEDAYAVGDIATYPYYGPPNQKNPSPVRVEHWNVAQDSGRRVAGHIATGEKPAHFVPIFWSALGVQLRYCGNTMTSGYDDVIITGSPDLNKFIAYYTKGDDVVAVASMQKDPVVSQSAELMKRGGMLSKKDIQAGKDVLHVDVTARVVI
ncbi:hypothetical protein DFH27DRAFT_533605 [Peziza echinospora]|nr:hypothetical protein DFH27DRAFT_533605 [Peziza echinospora]